MRCDVLRTQDHKIPSEMSNTDIEVWRESAAYKTELEMASPRSLTKYVGQNRSKEARKKMERCHKFEFADGKTDKGVTRDFSSKISIFILVVFFSGQE